MVVLLDTNVLFDVLSKRQPHYAASNQILCLCRRKAIVGAVAYHTVVFERAVAGSFVGAWCEQRYDPGRVALGNERLGRCASSRRCANCGRQIHRHPQREGFQILPRAGAEPKGFSQALSPGLG